MTAMRSLVIVSVIAISLFACRSTVPTTRSGVEFMTDASAYAPGDSVRLQLVNHEDQEIGYNLCFSDLAREDEAGWVVVPDTMTVCTTELRLLAPGDTATYVKTLMLGVEPGTYRYQTGIEFQGDGQREEVGTNSFRIEE